MPFQDSKHLFRFWLAAVRASITREMEFRTNFLLGIARSLLWFGIFLLQIEIIFQHTTALAGWSKADVLIILGLSRLVEGIMNTFFGNNIAELPNLVQTGKFDLYLTKPLPAQFHLTFARFSLYQLVNVIAGIILLIYATNQQPTMPSLTQWLTLLLLTSCALTLYYSLLVLISSLVFFLERLEALWGYITLMTEPLTVPFNIFPRSLQTVLTYLIPLAFLVFVPAQAITGRLTTPTLLTALALTLIFFFLATRAWRAGLRRYSSASS